MVTIFGFYEPMLLSVKFSFKFDPRLNANECFD